MIERMTNLRWWQRPQSVWVSSLLSALILLTLFGLWNLVQTVWATEENLDGTDTAINASIGFIPW